MELGSGYERVVSSRSVTADILDENRFQQSARTYLQSSKVMMRRIWAKLIEQVGCGTAMPTAYILRSLLASHLAGTASPNITSVSTIVESFLHAEEVHPSVPTSLDTSARRTTILHLQDFNLPVLSLVTLPNLILATLPFVPPESLGSASAVEDLESVLPDMDQPGEIAITKELIKAVRDVWDEAGVELRFTYGHWSGFAQELLTPLEAAIGNAGLEDRKGYGLVLTAETIYSPESVDDLIDVLRNASNDAKDGLAGKRGGEAEEVPTRKEVEVGLEDFLGHLSVRDEWQKGPLRAGDGVVLLAAKVYCFFYPTRSNLKSDSAAGEISMSRQCMQQLGDWGTD